jgi:hypothetical protein
MLSKARVQAAKAARAVAADPVPASRIKLDVKLKSFFVEVYNVIVIIIVCFVNVFRVCV